MQLLILIAILSTFLSLAGFSENSANTLPAPLDWRHLVLALGTLPAILATLLFFRKPQIKESLKQRKGFAVASNLAVIAWFGNSILLAFFSDWTTTIRSVGNSAVSIQLLLALTPILISLGSIWFVHAYSVTESLSKSCSETICRIKVYVLITLIPLIGMLLLKDISEAQSGAWSDLIQMCLFPLAIVAVAFSLPFVVCWIFPTHSIADTQLGQQLFEIAHDANTKIHDIRIWGTGNRIVNAMVVGLFSFGRTVMITDRLIKDFELDEIKAVFLHELGHAKRLHLLQRLIAAAAPFFLTYVICQVCGIGDVATILFSIGTSLAGLASIARLLEYDADQFAIDGLVNLKMDPIAYRKALLRMKSINPAADNTSWLHPRISDRINRIGSLQVIRSENRKENDS